MAFGKVSKQDLVEAGLDPDEIKTSMAAIKDGSATKEDMTKVTSALDAIQASFKELETKLKTPVVTTTTTTGDDKNKTKTAEELAAEEQSEFYADPTGFVKKQVGGLGYQAAVEFKKLSRDLAFKEASKELPGFRNTTLKAEIEEEWKKYTPEIMARNNTDPSLLVKQVHDMIMGRHHDEIVQDRDKKDGKFNLVHGGGGGNITTVSTGGGSFTGNQSTELSEEEKGLAKKFGMTEDEWKKERVAMDEDIQNRMAGVGK